MADGGDPDGNEWDRLTSSVPGSMDLDNDSGSSDGGSSPVVTAASVTPPPSAGGRADSKDATGGILDVAGKVWNLPNTILGLAYGGLGYGAGLVNYELGGQKRPPDIQQGPNGLYFTNNPLQLTAMTLGNTTTFGTGDQYQPDSRRDNYPGQKSDHTLGNEEAQHTYQGEALGPFYFPAHAALGLGGLLFNKGWHGATNILEQGPHSADPHPWPP